MFKIGDFVYYKIFDLEDEFGYGYITSIEEDSTDKDYDLIGIKVEYLADGTRMLIDHKVYAYRYNIDYAEIAIERHIYQLKREIETFKELKEML
jgi:hypothetical protein